MTLEKDWDRLTKAFLKLKSDHWCPSIFLFADIFELRKADNKGIDFAIRRLRASEYSSRIRLHSGPLSPRYPLRVTEWGMTGFREYHYFLIEIPELQGKAIHNS